MLSINHCLGGYSAFFLFPSVCFEKPVVQKVCILTVISFLLFMFLLSCVYCWSTDCLYILYFNVEKKIKKYLVK